MTAICEVRGIVIKVRIGVVAVLCLAKFDLSSTDSNGMGRSTVSLPIIWDGLHVLDEYDRIESRRHLADEQCITGCLPDVSNIADPFVGVRGGRSGVCRTFSGWLDPCKNNQRAASRDPRAQ